MRLFLAIDLEESVRERIEHVQRKLASDEYDLKMVEAENLHLTLKFLGEVDEDKMERIESAVSGVVKGFHPFNLSLQGVGFFGSERFMKVIWAGVKEGGQDFAGLAKSLENKLSFIRKDEHEPSPHLTIARVKSGRNVQKLAHEVRSMAGMNLGETNVKEIKLKESMLTPQGPIYSDVKIFNLKGADDSG